MIILKRKVDLRTIGNSFTLLFRDKDLFNTTLNQGFKLVTGPLFILLIPFYITREVQGYWFSFMSVSALSIMADLGFTIIILQFSAHEFAFLRFENGSIFPVTNDKQIHLERLASLLRFSLNWLKKILLFVFPVILIIGIWLFNSKSSDVNWVVPWVIYTIGAALMFTNTVVLSFIEGCNNVAITQRIRFYNTVINFSFLFPLLVIGANLFALSIALLFSSVITSALIIFRFRSLLNQLWTLSRDKYHNWFPEFWSFFRKYALSVASGFFVVQIFTPLAFKFYGPVEAGKVGLTMSLTTAIFSISNVWFQSIAPKVNILTSQKNWPVLNKLIIERFLIALATYLLAYLVFTLAYIQIESTVFAEITNRFLPAVGILILFFHWLIQLPIYIMAFYLRAHKKEPYMYFSLIGSLATVLLTLITVYLLPSQYIYISLLLTSVFGLPFAYSIFLRRKAEWCI
jgi:hypothetical protein